MHTFLLTWLLRLFAAVAQMEPSATFPVRGPNGVASPNQAARVRDSNGASYTAQLELSAYAAPLELSVYASLRTLS